MAFIFGVATQEADLYKIFRDFITGRGKVGQAERSGAGNGELNNLLYPEGSAGIYETFTLTCVSPAVRGGSFGVQGSVSGTLPDATVGTVYKHALIEFYIDFGTVDFQVGDQFVITAATKPSGKAPFTYIRGGTDMKTETLTLTCLTPGQQLVESVQPFIPATFSVEGNLTGALPGLTQGLAYSNAVVRMLLGTDPGSANQYLAGDVITLNTSVNPLRAIGQHWEALRQVATVATSQFGREVPDTETQLILKGPGLAGTDSIFYGMTRSWSDASAYAYWTHFGMLGYAPSLTIQEQPSVQGGQAGTRPLHSFWSLQIPYVIIANGRCFKLITRSNIYYSQSYQGLYLPMTLPKYMGYPYFSGGTGESNNGVWSVLSDGRSSFWNNMGTYSAVALDEGNIWSPQYGSEPDGRSRWTSNRVDPWGMANVRDLRSNLDGTVPMFQAQLTPNIGFLDGVYAVPGRDGRQPEEIIVMRDGRRAIVSQNHHRSGFADFAAFTLE